MRGVIIQNIITLKTKNITLSNLIFFLSLLDLLTIPPKLIFILLLSGLNLNLIADGMIKLELISLVDFFYIFLDQLNLSLKITIINGICNQAVITALLPLDFSTGTSLHLSYALSILILIHRFLS